VFAIASHFHPILTFVSKAGAYPRQLAVINSISQSDISSQYHPILILSSKAGVCAIVSHFYPCLIFASKARVYLSAASYS
jgi:hypothetical protein